MTVHGSSRTCSDTVGVLTISHTCNYGAQLQAHALCRAIESLGRACEVIDYACPAVCRSETPRSPAPADLLLHPRSSLRLLRTSGERRRKYDAFRSFETDCMSIGPSLAGQGDMAKRYDTVVVGSDQVWGKRVTGGDRTFFLGDASCDGLRKVAYAASFGDARPATADGALLARELCRFDALGMREQAGADFISDLGIDGARHVLDPTLLLDAPAWREVAVEPSVQGPYVLAYFMFGGHERVLEAARSAARAIGAPVVAVNWRFLRPIAGLEYRNDATPAEFVGLVDDAEMVVTSSFHGVCLSAVLEKDLRYVLPDGVDRSRSRICDLARSLGLEAAEATSDGPVAGSSIDFSVVRRRLESLRADSLAFLEGALDGDESLRPVIRECAGDGS